METVAVKELNPSYYIGESKNAFVAVAWCSPGLVLGYFHGKGRFQHAGHERNEPQI